MRKEAMTYELATARTWAEIDMDAIVYNYHHALGELSPGVSHFVVLKANAYGLGAVALAKLLYEEGARLFAMACAIEAMEIRRVLPMDADILIMGITMPPEREMVLRAGLLCAVQSVEEGEALSSLAKSLGITARVHCKVDSGLNRLGFAVEEAVEGIGHVANMPNIRLEGVFSHLQRRSPEHDRLQGERTQAVCAGLAAQGTKVPMAHLLDSIGMWRYPENQWDAVRDAAFIIGHTFSDYPRPERLRFALSFKTRIVRVHDAAVDECLGYDNQHPLPEPTRVATLCVGYADGYPRAMSSVAEVEIHGKRCKVLGVVCMDLMTVDINEVPQAAVGDEVTLLGGTIDIETYAGFSGGYKNEYISMISRRVPRVYRKGGEIYEVVGYLP